MLEHCRRVRSVKAVPFERAAHAQTELGTLNVTSQFGYGKN